MLGKLNHPAEINVSEMKSLDLKSSNGRAIFHLHRAAPILRGAHSAYPLLYPCQGERLWSAVPGFYMLWLRLQGFVIS